MSPARPVAAGYCGSGSVRAERGRQILEKNPVNLLNLEQTTTTTKKVECGSHKVFCIDDCCPLLVRV